MSKPEHIVRMEAEMADLAVKLVALESFIGGNSIYQSLQKEDQELLCAQSAAMKAYAGILHIRIARAS